MLFWAAKAFEVSDVEFQFGHERDFVYPNVFFCVRDPDPVDFEAELEFNSKKGLSVYCYPLSRCVSMTFLKCRLSDKQGVLAEKVMMKEHLGLIPKDQSVGWDTFFPLPGDMPGKSTWRFVIEVEYEVPDPSPPPQHPADSPTSRLQFDLLHLLETAEGADVTFKVKGETIPAHKYILAARAPYFADMFGSSMEKELSNEVDVADMEPPVFRSILQFLYSGLPPTKLDEIAMELLVVADELDLVDLKNMCEARACCILNKGNVVNALILAERHCCEVLWSRATSVFHESISDLAESEHKLEKLKAEPDVLLKLLTHFARTSV